MLCEFKLFTNRVAQMSFKEVGDPHRPLVVPTKVPDGAVDGGVRHPEYSFLFDSLRIDQGLIIKRDKNYTDRYG